MGSVVLENSRPAVTAPRDRLITGVGMTLSALCVGFAINDNFGDYSPIALRWLTLALGLCIASAAMGRVPIVERACALILTPLLLLVVLAQPIILLAEMRIPLIHPASGAVRQTLKEVQMGIILVLALGLLQIFNLRSLRWPMLILMLAAFATIASAAFNNLAKDPEIDVLMFQQWGSEALLHGQNPYDSRVVQFPNIYEADTPFYGPGVVTPDGEHLTFGYPYFPLSLLMVLPGYILGGDVRYALVVALALSAALMCVARPGKWGVLAAAIFLLTPRALYVTDLAWTEPLLMLTFSVAMFCACRYPRALPYALGLYFATKQYTILSLPAILLLVQGPNLLKQAAIFLAKAAAVGTAITLPFFLWNPREFFRAVVTWQLVQPFRNDALSYLVWWVRRFHPEAVDLMKLRIPTWRPPLITPVVAVLPMIVLGAWRCVRSPAGFAVAVTLINFTFFAFNKQAFCNYYYFVIGTACWTIAAIKPPVLQSPTVSADSAGSVSLIPAGA